MLKNKLLLWSFAVLAVGCSKSKDYPTLFTHLEKNADSDEKILQRELAAIGGENCLKDIFNVSVVKAEIKELEKKYATGTKVQGKWRHLNLADLPIPQANFLKTYGDKLGDMNNKNAFDFSDCKDVPCLFNKIYGKEDNVAGYVHYLWYLKMGNLLGASNVVYGAIKPAIPGEYNGKKFPVSSYLYRDKEIYGFWRLLMMMKAPHTALADLKEIHRVPQGESFDFEVAERKAGTSQGSGETCGLAWSNGFVIMQDLCLSLYEDWESGYFYQAVLHELSHQVDYSEGRKIKKTYRSQEKDYLDLSFFYLNEYKNEKGETVRQWAHEPGIKLPSTYGGTSPAENYAETLSLFRTAGTVTKGNISSDHWDFTSKNYYFGKNFEKTYMIKNWVDANLPLITQGAFKAVSDCTKSAGVTASAYYKASELVIPLQATTVSCLGSKLSELSREIRMKLRVSDPDGCQILSEYNVRTEWEPAFKEVLTTQVNKYLKEFQTDKAYFARVQIFIDEIPKRDIANAAYLACPDEDTEASCYSEGVLNLALEKLAPLKLPQEHAQDLAQMYLDGHELADTKQYLLNYYKSFVKSNAAQVDEAAKLAWDKCDALPVSDDASPVGKNFTVGDGYMVSSLYNCLNTDFPDVAKSIVRNLAVGDLKVQHPKEEVILYNEVVPLLKTSLANLYQSKKDKELAAAKAYIESDEGKIRKAVLSDFAWVKDVLNASNIQRDCEALALSKIDFTLKFQVRREVFSGLTADACRNITDAPEYTKWLEDSKSVFADRSVDGLENRILELAKVQADLCVKQYPIDTNLSRIKFKKEREACLIGEWPAIEAKAIKEFESDPMVVRFKVDVNAVKLQLETNRRRHQLKIIKENF